MVFHVKLEINGRLIFKEINEQGNIAKILFSKFFDQSTELILSDSGNEISMEIELKKWDVSDDKDFGKYWSFKITGSSREIIRKAWEKFENKRLGDWGLKGENFKIMFLDLSDPFHHDFGPTGNRTVISIIEFSGEDETVIKKVIA